MDVLRDVNIANGIAVDSNTLTPSGGGERPDVAYAIDVLHPLALTSRP
jgi:hypothetical protein